MRFPILLTSLLALSSCQKEDKVEPIEPVEVLMDPDLAKDCLTQLELRLGEKKEFDHYDVQKTQAFTRARVFTDCLERAGVKLNATPELSIY